MPTKKRLLVQRAFEENWETGGFPEVNRLDRNLRVRTHQGYFHAILYRDLVDRHDVAHPKAVSDLARWLVDHTGLPYTVRTRGRLRRSGPRSRPGPGAGLRVARRARDACSRSPETEGI